jgi:hypothetical protein
MPELAPVTKYTWKSNAGLSVVLIGYTLQVPGAHLTFPLRSGTFSSLKVGFGGNVDVHTLESEADMAVFVTRKKAGKQLNLEV